MKLPSDYLKQGWCRYKAALDAEGTLVPVKHRDAVSWCLLGATMAADLDVDTMGKLIDSLATRTGVPSMYNDADGRTQAEVVELMMEVEKEIGL